MYEVECKAIDEDKEEELQYIVHLTLRNIEQLYNIIQKPDHKCKHCSPQNLCSPCAIVAGKLFGHIPMVVE